MKIILITSECLDEFPPVSTLLKVLERQGHEVTFISPFHDPAFELLHLSTCIHKYVFEKKAKWLTKYYKQHLKASLAFHMDRMLKRICINQIPGKYSAELQNADIVWILHENTMLLGGKRFTKRLKAYLYTMYELCIKNDHLPRIYDFAARKAVLTVVPEYFRAHIAKAYYNLSEMPAIIPNKPLDHPRVKNMPISDPEIATKINDLKQSGKKIIMYMGILSSERPLEPLIEATYNSDSYILAVLGARTPYLDKLQQKMGDRFEYLGVVKPPYHLEVASHAYVAYISYVANNGSINAVFCAPNKVYEFAGFGIPMLCNDNPGLKFTVEYNGMGVCVQDLSIDEITKVLQKIEKHSSEMSEAALRYYEEESVELAVQRTLARYISIKEEKK
ncbi:MAG: hypothetical protein IJW77_03405 [Clostridia bacterium]|nr:hypothetical protein [Clostridia bacterium]